MRNFPLMALRSVITASFILATANLASGERLPNIILIMADDMAFAQRGDPPLPMVEGKSVIKAPVDQRTLTKRYNMDVLPTFAAITDAPLPELPIDGKNILPILFAEPGAESPHEAFHYYRRRQLQAVRSGDWKWDTAEEIDETPRPGMLIHLGRDIGPRRPTRQRTAQAARHRPRPPAGARRGTLNPKILIHLYPWLISRFPPARRATEERQTRARG